MRRYGIVALVLLLAVAAQATTIYDIQTGLEPENTQVQLTGVVVVAARYNGVYVSEAPYGGYNGIWVYTGGAPGAAAGDVVDVDGEYYEYNGLSEVDCTGGSVVVTGAASVPEPTIVDFDYSSTENLTAQCEMYESCLITQDLCMTVTDLPDAYGEWWAWDDPDLAWTDDGRAMLYDDFWYDDTTVLLGDHYASVTGILHYSFGLFKLEPLADGIVFAEDCDPVGVEEATFGTVKAIYR
jgi:hypothetical protein